MNRRRLLQALVAAGVTGLAGCTSPDSEASAEQTPMDTPEPTPEPTPTPTPEPTPTATPEPTPTPTPEPTPDSDSGY